MFMQAGFALVETGFSRAKNAAHTMAMNFLVYSIGVLGFWMIGFGLQMGGSEVASLGSPTGIAHEFAITIGGKAHGLFGTSGFFLPPTWLTPAGAALFMFQLVFMDTAATIPTGALCERWKFLSFFLFSFVIAALIYPLYANWVWGGGFLSSLGKNFGLGHGHVDFAGSAVVHMTGGVIAFVGASLIGPRLGKYSRDGQVRAIPAHNIPMVVTGTFILAFGWFGFNAGSTLSGVDSRLAVIACNTMLASAGGACSGCVYSWSRFGKPDVTMMCNGMLCRSSRDNRTVRVRRVVGRGADRVDGGRDRGRSLTLGRYAAAHRRPGGRDLGARCGRRFWRALARAVRGRKLWRGSQRRAR